MKFYRRLTKTFKAKGDLIPSDSDCYSQIKDLSVDYYLSIFEYDEKQYEQFKLTGSVAGITDTTTNKLVFDFDKEGDLDLAKQDAERLCTKLANYGIDPNSLKIAFSGMKGFGVEILTNRRFTNQEFKNITFGLAKDISTFDTSVNDPNRLLRLEGTKHNKSGYYKTPLTFNQLKTLSTAEIVKIASNQDSVLTQLETVTPSPVELPLEVLNLKPSLPEKKVAVSSANPEDLQSIDFSKRVKGWSPCKWAVRCGYEVRSGDRHSKLMMLIATARALNETQEVAYYIAKNAMKQGALRYGEDECAKEDIWRMVKSVYEENWKGGTYTCKDGKTLWLTEICNSLGHKKCSHITEDVFIEVDNFQDKFKKFAFDIEKNTLKLGVEPVDEKVMITTSMLVGLLGAPSSGKTSLLLNFLNTSSHNNIRSTFYSMDMGLPLVYMRLIQKHFGISREVLFDIYRNNPRKVAEIDEKIKEEYKNVNFSFRSGMNVDDIRSSVIDQQEKLGEKIKLVGIDYLECISGPYADQNANVSIIANQLKDVANELDVAVMLLLQPQKHAGDPSDPLTSMRSVKGSSVIEQACSIIMSIHRPGFSPSHPEDDRFVVVNTVKDRMGSLMSVDCEWKGLTGSITPLPQELQEDLQRVRDRKRNEKAEKDDDRNW